MCNPRVVLTLVQQWREGCHRGVSLSSLSPWWVAKKEERNALNLSLYKIFVDTKF